MQNGLGRSSFVHGTVCVVASALGLMVWPGSGTAQVERLPEPVQQRMAEVGPGWGKDILGNIRRTLEVYTPLLAAAPRDGVVAQRDIAYGSDVRHRLDLYRPASASPVAAGAGAMPIVVFIHGGAYVAGERTINDQVYGNVPLWFAQIGRAHV